MSYQPNRNGRIAGSPQRLVVVRVEEVIEPKLTARTGAVYESPPHTREQALILARLLLGCTADVGDDEQRWTAPIAGGRRVVSIREELVR